MRSQAPVRADSKPSGIADEIGVIAKRCKMLEAIERLLKEGRASKAAALFERELHTLSQLSHPRAVEAYDHGVTSRTVVRRSDAPQDGDALNHERTR